RRRAKIGHLGSVTSAIEGGRIMPKARDHSTRETSTAGGLSRREVLGSTAVGIGAFAATGVREAVAAPAGDEGIGNLLERTNADRNRRILLRGGTIISMDPAVGDFARGDILIEGDKIAGIGPNLSVGGGTIEVDVGEMIIIPGFCDPHIHSWQGQLARLI